MNKFWHDVGVDAKAAAIWIGHELGDLVTALNAVGSMVLAYALQNQDVVSQLPFPVPGPLKVIIPAGWWLIVQIAKARAIKKAANG